MTSKEWYEVDYLLSMSINPVGRNYQRFSRLPSYVPTTDVKRTSNVALHAPSSSFFKVVFPCRQCIVLRPDLAAWDGSTWNMSRDGALACNTIEKSQVSRIGRSC